jgi:hypothetical protein
MASGSLNPIDNPQAWDFVTISGVNSPGLAEVSEWPRHHEWDVKKGKGTLGGTVTFVGRPPATGKIKFMLWTAAHFQQWESFRALMKYDPTKKAPQAVDIFYPSLADINITSVVVEDIGNIVHEGGQLYSITVAFLEYFPPPKASAVGTPSMATGGPGGPGTPPPVAQDAEQAEIAKLLAQAQAP